MAKLNIATVTRAVDEMLLRTDDLRHRQILENYRRHAILEVINEWKEILAADMTVEHPVYYVNVDGASTTLDGYEQVSQFYGALEHSESTVMVPEDEKLAVADWGFASEAIVNFFVSGVAASAAFQRGESKLDADPEKFYVIRRRMSMQWLYDERGRLIGEHVYEHADHVEIREVPESEFITLNEAREKLLPLLRPLPVFESAN